MFLQKLMMTTAGRFNPELTKPSLSPRWRGSWRDGPAQLGWWWVLHCFFCCFLYFLFTSLQNCCEAGFYSTFSARMATRSQIYAIKRAHLFSVWNQRCKGCYSAGNSAISHYHCHLDFWIKADVNLSHFKK